MDTPVDGTIERLEISDLITKLFISVDERRWQDAAGSFGPKVLFDLSSQTGAKPSRTSPKRILEQWQGAIEHLESTHHQIGNLLVSVEGGEAGAFCYVTTTHYHPSPTGGSTHTIVGTYDFHLSKDQERGWVIDALRFNRKYEDGNVLLSELAKRKGAKTKANKEA